MSEITVFYVLVFVATVLLVISVYSHFVSSVATPKRVNRRFAMLQGGIAGEEVLQSLRRERWVQGDDYSGNLSYLKKLIVQSGIRLDYSQLILTVLIVGISSFAVFYAIFGFQVLSLIGTVLLTACLLFLYLRYERNRRVNKFREQLPDLLDLLVRSLRAGHPLPVSFSLAAREMPDPAGTELGLVSDEVQFGSTIVNAVKNLSYRVGDPDLDYLVTSISIQGQTGGNLGEVLARLARLVRERFRLSRKARTLTSEARFSAIALSLFPVVLFGLMLLIAPNYYAEVWGTPSFNKMLMTSGGLLLVGNFVMRRLANIKF
jgi:tight adherence protein B